MSRPLFLINTSLLAIWVAASSPRIGAADASREQALRQQLSAVRTELQPDLSADRKRDLLIAVDRIISVPKLRDPAVAGLVRPYLRDADPQVRLYAASVLIHLHDSASAPDFRRMALEDADTGNRAVATGSMALLDPSDSQALLESLLQDPHPQVALYSAAALGDLGRADGFDRSLTDLGSADPLVRNWAARALGHIASEKGLRPLEDALAAHRVSAPVGDEALLRIKTARFSADSDKTAFLDQAARDPDPDLRAAACWMLASLSEGSPSAADALRRIATDPRHPAYRQGQSAANRILLLP